MMRTAPLGTGSGVHAWQYGAVLALPEVAEAALVDGPPMNAAHLA